MSETITIWIDGKEIKAEKGANLLKVARDNGFNIPGLCFYEKITPTGDCRLCMVKIEGRPAMTPSCLIKIEDGMKVTAFDQQLEETRAMLVDVLLSEHNDDCITCERDGDCQLQDLAFHYGLDSPKRKFDPIWKEIIQTPDSSSPVLLYESSKCIKCARCVKACQEIQGKGVLSIAHRGIHSHVVAGSAMWSGSECDGCGECVQACPVGALMEKPVYGERVKAKDIQKKMVTTCPYCGVGCQLELWIKDGKIAKVKGADSIPNYGSSCVKGRFGLDFVNPPDRLRKPLMRKDGKLVEVEWTEAIEYTAKRFAEIKKANGPDALAGLSSARCTNEENFVFQKFMRAVIGTNNVDHCDRLCHASTVAGLATTLGSGAMTNSAAELEHANVIIVIGSNTTETHPVIATFIKRAVLFNNAKLIVIDPRKIDLVRYATLWLRQKNGTDIAVANGMMNAMISHGWENKEFINNSTEGFEAMKELVKKYDPKMVEGITGIPADSLIEAARLYATAEKAAIVYAMGITQHAHGTDNVKSMANLAMITGQIGRESTGVNPLRGQGNVQGACDMGALPNLFPGYQKVDDPAIRAKFEAAWKRPNLPDKVGLTVTEIMRDAHSGKIKGLYIMGENPMMSDPDLNHVKKSLEDVDFLVVQDIFLTPTAELADVVFPASAFVEKGGTYTNTERRVLPMVKILDAPGEARDDAMIIQALANALGEHWNYGGADDILLEVNAMTPQYTGITAERLAAGEKLQWPCPNAQHPGTRYLHKDGKFTRGKGLFSALEHVPTKEMPDKEYPYVLSTGRNLYHYHTDTMTGRTVVIPQFSPGAYVEMCDADCVSLGVAHGDMVRVSSRRGSIDIAVRLTDCVAQGSIFIPFHFKEAAANILTNNAIDPIAKIPEFKACAVRIEKATN